MPRKTYPRTDETFKVLSEFEKEIAAEMEVDVSYINKIKNNVEPDRFPQFREIFRAACNASRPDGAKPPVELWLNSLSAIYVKSRTLPGNTSELSSKLLEKINADAKALTSLVEALADGKLSKQECHTVLAAMAKNEETNNRIKTLVQLWLSEFD